MTKDSAKNSFDRWIEEHPEGVSETELERWYKEHSPAVAKAELERYLKEHPPKPDPHDLFFYLRRAEALLNDDAIRLPESMSLPPNERNVLVRHLTRARRHLSQNSRDLLVRHMMGNPTKMTAGAVEIAVKPDPLTLTERRARDMFIGIMYRLVPHLELLKNTVLDEFPFLKAEEARKGKAKKSDKDLLNIIVREETKPGLEPKVVLQIVRKRWGKKGEGGKEDPTDDAILQRIKRRQKRTL